MGKRSAGDDINVAVWEDHHGPVPKGYHVHHRDEDTSNNKLRNLKAITPKRHKATTAALIAACSIAGHTTSRD